jgi:ferritin-like metal-binding protein YciE
MALFAGNIEDLRSLYTTELRYLLSTEQQIIKALPKMIEAASDMQLKKALQTHLQETEQQERRLDDIMRNLAGDDSEKKCSVTAALISAGETTIKATKDAAVRDVGIIGSAQKIEHYEIAAYGTVRSWAQILGETDHARLLEQTLQEEKNADKMLTGIAEERNPQAGKAA